MGRLTDRALEATLRLVNHPRPKTRRAAPALLALLVALLWPPSLWAEEHAVKQADLPTPALAAVQQKYPAGELTGFSRENDHGAILFHARLKSQGKELELRVSPEGKIASEATRVALKDLPPALAKTLAASAWAGWKIVAAERVVQGGNEQTALLEVMLQSGKQRAKGWFDKDSQLVRSVRK